MPLPSRPLPPHGILWPYKSQRKATNQGGTKEIKKTEETGERTRETGRIENTRGQTQGTEE